MFVLDYFNMEETFIQRLDRYMKYASLNDNQVTNQSGLTVGLINSARKRNKSLSGDNIGKILYAFPDLNARWLLTGEGEMIKQDNSSNLASIDGKVEVSSDAWLIIKQQAESLASKDRQVEDLINLLKKENALRVDNATCAVVSGSDLEK